MADREALTAPLAELLEALQSSLFDPLNEQSALRRGLREELRAQLGPLEHRLWAAALASAGTAVNDAADRPLPGGLVGTDSKAKEPFDNPPCGSGAVEWLRPPPEGSGGDADRSASEEAHTAHGSPAPVEEEQTSGSSENSCGPCDRASDCSRTSCSPQAGRATVRTNSHRSLVPSLGGGRRLSIDMIFPPVGSGAMVWLTWARHRSYRLIHKGYGFDVFMGLIILANSVSVGLELQWDLEGERDKMTITYKLEHVFLVMFVLELVVRFLADGKTALQKSWFRFDVFLVGVGAVALWIVEPIIGSASGQMFELVSQTLIMRILRLFRLIRALRFVELFQDLWKLVNGIMGSLRTVISACALIILTIYIYACLGIELITKNAFLQEDPITAEIVRSHFSSLQVTMLTLVQFANADSIAEVYTPLIRKEWYLVLYFGAVWLFVTISLMNLVTAIIVDNAIKHGSMDREMQVHTLRKRLKALEPHIQAVFTEMDANENGMLSLEEVLDGLKSMEESGSLSDLPEDLQYVMDAEKLKDLFDFLDITGSGDLNHQEFFDGVCHLMLQSVPIETTQMLQLLRSNSRVLQLIRDITCFQKECATLATDYVRGDSHLSVVATSPVQVGDGAAMEHSSLAPNFYSVPLMVPLVGNHRAGTVLSSRVCPQ